MYIFFQNQINSEEIIQRLQLEIQQLQRQLTAASSAGNPQPDNPQPPLQAADDPQPAGNDGTYQRPADHTFQRKYTNKIINNNKY